MSQPQVMRTQPAPIHPPKPMTFTSIARTTAPMPSSMQRPTPAPVPVRTGTGTAPMNVSYKTTTTSMISGHKYTNNNNYRVNSAAASNTYPMKQSLSTNGSKPPAPTNTHMRIAQQPVQTNNKNRNNNNNIMIRNTNGSVTRAVPMARTSQMVARPTYVNNNSNMNLNNVKNNNSAKNSNNNLKNSNSNINNNNINNRQPFTAVKNEFAQHNNTTTPATNTTYMINNNNNIRNQVQLKKPVVKSMMVKQEQQQQGALRTSTSGASAIGASRLSDSGLREALPPFLKKLRTITETVTPDIAAWSVDGRTFMINNNPRFEAVLGKHFKGNISTFVRQLHFYTFKKAEKNGGGWSFAHKSFLRDYPHLMYEIKRKTRNEPGEGAASQAEVQSLRTQVAFLQNVVEELRTQLDVVLKVVDKEEEEEEEKKKKAVDAGSTQVGGKKNQQNKKQKKVAASLPVSKKTCATGGSGVNHTSAATVASAAAAAAISGVKRLRVESGSSPSSTAAGGGAETAATANIDPFADWFEACDMSSSSSPISQATSIESAGVDTIQPLSLNTNAFDDIDMMDAASLGSLTEEDWLNTLAMDCDEGEQSSNNSDAGNSVDFLMLSRSNSFDLAPLSVAPITPTSKQVLADASDATRLVADATKLDVGTVAKVLECLRVAAVKLAADSAAAPAAPLADASTSSSSSSSSGAQVLTPRSPSTLPLPIRTTSPVLQTKSTAGATSSAVRTTGLHRSTSAPNITCAQQARRGESTSTADQAAMLLPLLMHIPQVQSALRQYQQFDKVTHTTAHA